MTEWTKYVIALLISIIFIIYIVNKNNKEEEEDDKKSNIQIGVMFLIIYVISYMIISLIMDSNDDKKILSNIKIGEPPF